MPTASSDDTSASPSPGDAPVQPDANRDTWPAGAILNFALLGFVWIEFIRAQHVEWEVNAQYSYGYLVPLLALYLLYLRWLDHPTPKPPPLPVGATASALVLAGLAFMLPVNVVLEANPEWRLLLWTQGAICFCVTVLLTFRWGGIPWLLHFIVPLSLMLFAIPWPTGIENGFINSLMTHVAAITVEVLNFSGIYAERFGNIIQLRDGMVGVEEACSGVRSFQSSLMAAYFLGEMFRFRWIIRIPLIVVACIVAFFFNLMRTLALTGFMLWKGHDFLEKMHDSTGGAVTVLTFLTVLGISLLIDWWQRRSARRAREEADAEAEAETETSEAAESRTAAKDAPAGRVDNQGAWLARWTRYPVMICATTLLLLNYPLTNLWYMQAAPDPETRVDTHIAWEAIPYELKDEPISDTVRAQLRFDEGKHALWQTATGAIWQAFFLEWDAGKISSFAGVHQPTTCLPAAGFELEGQGVPIFIDKGGLRVRMETYTFTASQHTFFVFFAVWDDHPNYFIPSVRSARDRIHLALSGKRVVGRKSLEIVITGLSDLEEAREQVKLFLKNYLQVNSNHDVDENEDEDAVATL